MVMFKAPWVKVSAMASEEKSNIFQATILSMQNEEAILQIKTAQLNFVQVFIVRMAGKWDKKCGYILSQNKSSWQH